MSRRRVILLAAAVCLVAICSAIPTLLAWAARTGRQTALAANETLMRKAIAFSYRVDGQSISISEREDVEIIRQAMLAASVTHWDSVRNQGGPEYLIIVTESSRAYAWPCGYPGWTHFRLGRIEYASQRLMAELSKRKPLPPDDRPGHRGTRPAPDQRAEE